MATLARIMSTTQLTLFPDIETHLGQSLTSKQELFVTVVELAEPERLISATEWQRLGRPRHWRLPMLLAFIAKAVHNYSTTAMLREHLLHSISLRRLCGWERSIDIPSESTFSRAFAEFADLELPQRIQAALVKTHLGEKLVGHLSRDSSAIHARERPAVKTQPKPRPRRRRGRPRKGEQREPLPPRRLELQGGRTLGENLADLPAVCDSGGKKNSKGHTEYWRGYKLHLDVSDTGVPISAILTSASLHDSQAAIPLAQMSAQRVTSLYDLMDSGYDASEIRAFSARLGHVALIDPSQRQGGGAPLTPAQAIRYHQRTEVERIFGDLKDNHGGQTVRVRGGVKVMAHLMYGLIVVAVKGLCRLLE